MRHVILATAGHIDHGKTELVRALTGIDTDRLPEEKARGITIDLGFAHATLGEQQVAFIDVPGHERFVKNMLAGVGGIDLALLIVAADESVMPQTREHLAILELLAVPRGVVAVTKTDLADRDLVELVRLEVGEFVRGTFLEKAPIVPVSARSGAGLEDLRAALAAAAAAATARDAAGPFRLHVDRAFSIKGFGSVVTGTVVSGEAAIGDDLDLSPGHGQVKVRGIEVHGESVERVRAGSRAALNLAGVELHDLARGQQLLPPHLFPPGLLLDVRLRLLASAPPLRPLARVHLHLGAVEVLARVKLLDAPGETALAPGGEGLAQLRLEQPLVAWPGDRFIVRSYSPVTTIGGGVVVDVHAQKHRGRGAREAAALRALEAADLRQRLLLLVAAAGGRGATTPELVARTGRLPAAVEKDLAALPEIVRVEGAVPRSFARAAWDDLAKAATAIVREFHAREPLRPGMSREELRGRVVTTDAASARQLLEELAAQGTVRLAGDLVALAGHRVNLSDDETDTKAALEASYRAAGLNPPATKDALEALGAARARGEKLLPVLVREGRLVALPGGIYVHAEPLAELKSKLREAGKGGKPLTVPHFKELSGTSRKYAIPLLEHLDAIKFTRRVGDARVVVGV